MKKSLLILFTVIFAISLNTQAEDFSAIYNSKTIYYNITSFPSRKVKVTFRGSSYNSYSNEYSGSVTIPDSVLYDGNYYKVDSIGDQAFQSCSGLTSVTIPNSVTSIGYAAFSGCTGLTLITIPNSVTYIGNEAFNNTPYYNNKPDGVVYINNVLYYYKGTMPANTSINIQSGTVSISPVAFWLKSGLTSITIPNSVTSIGGAAFSGCTGLTLITIPSSVTSIGGAAFSGCTGLTLITIPSSVTSIGNSAFQNCTSLETVYFNAVRCEIMGEFYHPVFGGCINLSLLLIGDSVWSIPYFAFKGCNGLNSLTIGQSVTQINGYAFWGCGGLTSITIPNSVTSIGESSFSYCIGLTSITIPNSVTSIGYQAFMECSGLTSITIPNSVTSIGNSAFYGCRGLTSITIQAVNPPAISSNTFENVNLSIPLYVPCTSLSSYQSNTLWNQFTNIVGVEDPLFINTSICQGELYNNYGFNFTADTSGTYTQNLQTINGCDSMIVLNLTVNLIPIVPEDLSVQVRTNFIELNWQDNGSSYVIYRNNDSLTTTTMPIYLDYDIINNQPYCYKVKSTNGDCESEFSNIVCKTFLSIEDIHQTNITTKLYPNPANGITTLSVDGLDSDADITIYDIQGRVLKRMKLKESEMEVNIDLTELIKGIYQIRIVNNNFNITKKLIVN